MDNYQFQDFKPKGIKITLDERNLLRENNLKWCPKCVSVRPIDNFCKSNTSDGLNGTCKDCTAKTREKNRQKLNARAKEYYQENKDEKLKWAAEYRELNPEKVKESKKLYYENNKDKVLEKNKAWRLDNIEAVKEKDRKYHQKNRSERNAFNKQWRKENSEHVRNYINDKYQNNEEFHIWQICRQLVRRAYLAIGTKKERSSREFLNYSAQDLKEHIEKQFTEGMSWDNHGEWHIDHIIPISQAKTLEEGIKLSKLSNLQPLWAEDNLLKKNKI